MTTRTSRKRSKIKIPAAAAQIVAIAMREPVHVRIGEALPWPEIDSEPIIMAAPVAPQPKYEITLAFVDEKIPTNKISEIGLMDHHGRAPMPPGFEKRAKFGPPPATANPGSRKRFLGLNRVENDHGVLTRIGAITNVRRRHNLS